MLTLLLKRGGALLVLPALLIALSSCDEGADVATLAQEIGGIKLYGANGGQGNLSDLMELDPLTGAVVNTIGPIGFAVTGLAKSPTTGNLYGVTSNKTTYPDRGALIQIDKTTGAGTFIGFEYGTASFGAADITFTSDGTLYGWSENSDVLVSINTTTGLATEIGVGVSSAGSGIAAKIPGNTLYLTPHDACGEFFTVDRTTGVATAGPTMSGACNRINALAFAPGGILFGVENLGGTPALTNLIAIDLTTGTITTIGPSADMLDAILFY